MLRLLVFTLVACASPLIVNSTQAQPTYATRVAHYSQRQFSYHRQVAELDQSVRLQRAEIASLRRRLEEWEPMDRFRTGRALIMDVELTRLALMRAEMNLQHLQQAQFDLTRSRGRGW